MVNTEGFIKRLETILEYYSLSASAFADKIDVQRSGLSHLLSGRNKPSLDFVMKITDYFPEVDLYWLLKGKGVFPKAASGGGAEISSPALPSYAPEASDIPKANEENRQQDTPIEVNNTVRQKVADKDIDRIVVFYNDSSFASYTPGK